MRLRSEFDFARQADMVGIVSSAVRLSRSWEDLV